MAARKPKPLKNAIVKNPPEAPAHQQIDTGAGSLPIQMSGARPTWWQVLHDNKWPTEILLLDFETYYDSDYTLRKLSIVEYIADRRFEELGLAYLRVPAAYPFHPIEPQWVDAAEIDRQLAYWTETYGPRWERATVLVQNARFDCGILAFRHGIRPKNVIDLKALSLNWDARKSSKLADIAKEFGLPEKGDTAKFKNVSWKTRPAKRTRKTRTGPPPTTPPMQPGDPTHLDLIEYAKHDAWLEWWAFTQYMPRMSRPHVELAVQMQTLNWYLHPKLGVDYAEGERIRSAMNAKIDEAINRANDVLGKTGKDRLNRVEMNGETVFEAQLRHTLIQAGDNPSRYMKLTKKGEHFAMAKTDPEREHLLHHADEAVRTLMEARIAVKSWPLHIARVDRIMNQARAGGDKLPVPLNYYGGHTGRWSGAEQINLQNLGSRGDELVSAVRGMLIAPEGHVLVIVDLSAIEARGTAWVSGQQDLCDLFARGAEVYCHYAGKVVGKTLRKATKTDPPPVAKYLTRMRNMGKVQVLGCGYGMGPDKCQAYAASSYGIDLTHDEARELVYSYRKSVPNIVNGWYDLERAFVYAFKYQKHVTIFDGRVQFLPLGDEGLQMILPSGRATNYHRVRVKREGGEDSIRIWNPRDKSWGHCWGGHLMENVVQSFCRDLLAEAQLECDRVGIPIVHSVHDELIAVVPKEQGDKALARAIDILRTAPDWCADMPLDAEGVVTERYGGH